MIATLKKGKIKIVDPDKNIRYLEINGGTLQVQNNKILILAD